ncbi:MAG: LpqB family beta-propeller domain-containing protein [Anaerolineae bacterium]
MPRPASNPFTPDRPVTEEERFFGREDIIDWIEDRLAADQRMVLLFGTPRMGKTSLLYRLRSKHRGRMVAVYVDLETLPPSDTKESLWRLAEAVHTALAEEHANLPSLERLATGSAMDAWRQEWLPAWRPLLQGKRILLLVDGLVLEQVNQGIWADLVLGLQELSAQEREVQVVVAVRGASTASAQPVPAFRGLPVRDLEPLTEAQTEELLVGLARYQLGYDYDAIRRIHELSGGHPYLVQLYGAELFRSLAPYGQVTIHIVGDLVRTITELADPLFSQEWSALSPEAQIILAAIGSLQGYRGTVTPWDLVVHLRRNAVHRTNKETETALNELVNRRVMHWYGASAYALRTELWRPWLARTRPLEAVLNRRPSPRATGSRRRLGVEWGSVLLWLGLSISALLIIKVWNDRSAAAPTRMPLPTLTRGPVTPRPTATAVVLPGRLAYQAQESSDQTWYLWTMRDNGTDPVRLSDGNSEDTQPAWSPDGNRLAFVSNRSGNRDIWIMGADGSHLTNITNSGADEWTPAWSPDGLYIAFSSNRDGNWELYTAKADGTQVHRVTWSAAPDYSPSWSPDGGRLAFVSERDGNPEIYVVNRDGTELVRLTQNQVTDLSPRWSPDGKRIVFASYRDGNMEIYVMAPDGTGAANLSNDPGSDEHGPTWSPDGRWIAYYSNRDGHWDIWVMLVTGSQKTNLTASTTNEQAPAWQPRVQ